MSLSPSLSATLAASITRMADKRITGQEDSDEEEDEDESDDDEAEHSDDGDSEELEGSDKHGSDEVEHSDESDDDEDEDDQVFIGVFNPRHSRGESTFKVRVERSPDGMGTNLVYVQNRS
jgi:hypothetical protein